MNGNPPYVSDDEVMQELLGSIAGGRWSLLGLQVLKRGGFKKKLFTAMVFEILKNERNATILRLNVGSANSV